MTLTLRVLAPDQSIYDGTADEVILPTASGQMGILTGHVTMLTALDSGVVRVSDGSGWAAIAVMGGFAEVEDNTVTVLVNAAELGNTIDPAQAEANFDKAREAAAGFEGQPSSPEKVKAQQALSQARARLQATKA